MKKEVKQKEPIRVRTKSLANASESLYLDIYTNGKRKYEFLRLYLVPEKTKEDKNTNLRTLQLANAIKAKKIVELQNNEHGFSNRGLRSKIKLTDYIKYIADKDEDKLGRKAALYSLIHHFNRFDSFGITFKQLDKDYIIDFVKYLKTAKQEHSLKEKTINPNTQAYYYKMLRYCLNYAVSDDIIIANPMEKIKAEDKPKKQKSIREFLTLDEIKVLIKTDLKNKTLKQAFLFSCFCGLRHCDVNALTWGNIQKDKNNRYFLKLKQQKIQEEIILPLSDEAFKWLPTPTKKLKDEKVFAGLITLGRTNEVLPKWAKKAGINKHVTFHVARHTHATLMITLGVDVYTVSKLLGHTSINTTQIYAKLVDEKKRDAVDLINNIID